jgi:hypothetical protein
VKKVKLVKTIKAIYKIQRFYDLLEDGELLFSAADDELNEALETLQAALREWCNDGDKETRKNRRRQRDTVCRLLGTTRFYIFR